MANSPKISPIAWLKKFKKGLVLSFTDLNFYVDILNSPLKFSLKFVFFFYILIGIISGIYFAIVKVPEYRSIVDQTELEIREYYPADWMFDWDGESLASLPLGKKTINFPSSLPKRESLPESLAIIDAQTTNSPENIPALIYINSKNLYVNSLSGFWSDLALSDLLGEEKFNLNREILMQKLPSYTSEAKSSLSIIPILVTAGMSIGLFLTRLLSLIFDVIIIHFIMTLLKKPIPYKKVFQLTLHILVPVEVLQQATTLFYPTLDIPMFTISFWTLTVLILFHFRNLHMVKIMEKKEKK